MYKPEPSDTAQNYRMNQIYAHPGGIYKMHGKRLVLGAPMTDE